MRSIRPVYYTSSDRDVRVDWLESVAVVVTAEHRAGRGDASAVGVRVEPTLDSHQATGDPGVDRFEQAAPEEDDPRLALLVPLELRQLVHDRRECRSIMWTEG